VAIIKGIGGAVYLAQYGGGATSFTKTAMTPNVDATVFTVTTAAKRFWDPDTALIVYYNDDPVTNYASAQKAGGIVTWASTPGAEAVTVSGKSLAVATLGQVRSWTLDTGHEFEDVTCMQDDGPVMMPTYKTATAKISGFYADSTVYAEMSGSAARVAFDLYVSTALGLRYTGYGMISADAISAAVSGMVEQDVELTINDGPYFVSG
jgi:hypothetical protein